MKHTLALSIVATSLAALSVINQPAYADVTPPANATSATASHGGKCANGKCGTEKIYSKAKIDQNPQDRLVRTRDGKCGSTAQGHAVKETREKQLAEGVCGQ